MGKIKKVLLLSLVLLSSAFGSFSIFRTAQAADLSFTPTSGSFAVGKTFSVDVDVTNNTQAINAISGTISFPANLVSVTDLVQDNSIIKLWVDQPTYSNTDGTINFGGVILNPGFSAATGKIFTIHFAPRNPGTANLIYTDGTILANDGKATTVLGKMGTASFSTTPAAASSGSTFVAPLTADGTPAAPIIISSTNPDPTKWYNNSQPTFSWKVPDDVSAVRLLYGQNSLSIPSKVYSPAIAEKTIDMTSDRDGVYYFHAQFKNEKGYGLVAHQRYQIDRQAPSPFSLTFSQGTESDNPQPAVEFNATDSLSGISRYDITIDGGKPISYVQTDNTQPYVMPLQNPGKHTIVVAAFDGAGNTTATSADFTVDPIDTPVIKSYTDVVEAGDVLKVSGTTYPSATVTFTLAGADGKTQQKTAQATSDGTFAYLWPSEIIPGKYSLTLIATDTRGAKSLPTKSLAIEVKAKSIIWIILDSINYLLIAIIGLLSLFCLVLLFRYVIRHFTKLKKKVVHNVQKTETALHKESDDFRDEMAGLFMLLKQKKGAKKRLTAEEKKIYETFEKHLATLEDKTVENLEVVKTDL